MNLFLSILLSLTFLSPAVQDGGGGKKPKKTPLVTVEGSFSSVRGVMKPLSCYCFDSGYITTDSGDKVAICFEKNELEDASKADDKFSCDRIRVSGTYVLGTNSGDGACPGGSMRYLKVSKFQCLK